MDEHISNCLKKYGLTSGEIFSDWLLLDVNYDRDNKKYISNNNNCVYINLQHNDVDNEVADNYNKKGKKFIIKLVFEKLTGEYEKLFMNVITVILQKFIIDKSICSFELPKYGDVIINDNLIMFTLILNITKFPETPSKIRDRTQKTIDTLKYV